ncbi:MAG: aminopeptidase P family N-terminal domain-containing protein, partial [Candidatus Flemingiibacterium sp.]
MTPSEKLAALREIMKKESVDHLLVVSDDYHQSEYVGDFFKSRAYISGFTGSAGTLVISLDSAKLFTDGRYYIQAERQLAGSGIDLMRSGSEGVPTPTEYIISIMKPGDTLAFDGKCVSAKLVDSLKKKLPEGARLRGDTDFPALIWPDRPAIPSGKIYSLDLKYAGKSHSDKLADVRKKLADEDCRALVMSSLCDIAWFYNLRGVDVEDTPVFLSYCIVTTDADILFAGADAVSDVKEQLVSEGVTVRPYGEFYDELTKLSGKVMLDRSAVNSTIVSSLSDCEIVDRENPTLLMKAIKNDTELEHLRRCHIADGLAVTKFMIELKYSDRELDEITADDL